MDYLVKKNALYIVPHMDDELLVGGSTICDFVDSNAWDVYIAFLTNGDFFSEEAEIRQNEALLANRTLGIPLSNIIFLGYGDQWNSSKHIYNSESNKIYTSYAGKTETYAIKSHPEYCYLNNKKHNLYTRDSIICDIKMLIMNIFPQVIFTVDFDAHPDHRALLLFLKECLRDILIQSKGKYVPLVLSKLAYEGIYTGDQDYFEYPSKPTKLYGTCIKSNPFLDWESRIIFQTCQKCITKNLSDNILYKAAKCYKTQEIQFIIPRAINSDIVYWRIETDNISIFAEASASSGTAKFINDFKNIDSDDINNKNCTLSSSTWMPDKDDKIRQVNLKWPESRHIKKIIICENPDGKSKLEQILVKAERFSSVIDLQATHSRRHIIDTDIDSYYLSVKILKGTNSPGISEIEVFEDYHDINEYGLPMKIGDITRNNVMESKQSGKSRITMLIRGVDFSIKELLFNKMFPNEYELRKKFGDFNKKYIIFYKFKYCFRRIRNKITKNHYFQ